VRADARQHLVQPGVVLHELAGQLDRIPRHAVDAGDTGIADARQHVVQAVAEFMEQRHDIIVRQQRRAAVLRRERVAHEVCDR
jgi:chorismate mutase